MTAKNPSMDSASMDSGLPVASNAPRMAMPEMAFDPDMSGVCKVWGTFEISSAPAKQASTKMVKPMMIVPVSIVFSLTGHEGLGQFMNDLAIFGDQ